MPGGGVDAMTELTRRGAVLSPAVASRLVSRVRALGNEPAEHP